jgi:hypothetical protein
MENFSMTASTPDKAAISSAFTAAAMFAVAAPAAAGRPHKAKD